MSRLLEVENLQISFKTFFGEVEAVRGVSFGVDKGELVAIVGESGSGKTVTTSAINKLLPEPPAMYKAGKIIFDGTDLLPMKEKEIRHYRGKEISMIFQDPMTSLNPTMKIGKQIIEGLVKGQGVSKDEAYERALKILELVSVPEPEKRMKQYPHEFSGGMRQRVMIALAMISKPKLLIADEPTTALDVTTQDKVLELIKRLQRDSGTSVIFITHDLGVVAEIADRVLVMYNGQIVETGSVYDIFDEPLHPYTRGLMRANPNVSRDSGELYALPDVVPHPVYIQKEDGSYILNQEEEYVGDETEIIVLGEERSLRVHLQKEEKE